MQINEKIEAARVGVAAVGVTAWGLTLNEWVAVATIIYMVIQTFILIPKAYAIVLDNIKIIRRKDAP